MKYSSEFINHKSLNQTVWSIVELDVSLSPSPIRSAAGFGSRTHGPGLGLGLGMRLRPGGLSMGMGMAITNVHVCAIILTNCANIRTQLIKPDPHDLRQP